MLAIRDSVLDAPLDERLLEVREDVEPPRLVELLLADEPLLATRRCAYRTANSEGDNLPSRLRS